MSVKPVRAYVARGSVFATRAQAENHEARGTLAEMVAEWQQAVPEPTAADVATLLVSAGRPLIDVLAEIHRTAPARVVPVIVPAIPPPPRGWDCIEAGFESMPPATGSASVDNALRGLSRAIADELAEAA